MRKKVALLDAGAQAENVIKRRVLEQGYSIEKFPVNVSPSQLESFDAIIISGGPRSVYDANALLPHPNVYLLGKPIMGICYGLQAIVEQYGGKVVRGERGQYGRSTLDVLKNTEIFSGLAPKERVLMSHFDVASKDGLPAGFEVYGTSEGFVAAIGNIKRRIYATQFHPELIPVTRNGRVIFKNFFQQVCGFPPAEKRTIQEEIESAERHIRESVGSDKYVMHYVSGGVDSTVMALLLSRCVEPDRLHMRVLDTGTMRRGEIHTVESMAHNLRWSNFGTLDVKERFYTSMREISTKQGTRLAGPLCYTIDPEHKRKLFGTEYAAIALTEMNHLANECGIPLERFLLGQGTLRPDVIESGDQRATLGEAHLIKSHHNAVDALKNIPKVEPLIELFKDQVRLMGIELGLSEEIAYKQPYPGPGLYCRIVGYREERIPDEFLSLNECVNSIARNKGLHAHVLPIKTVGVQGDERSYKHPVIISGDIDWQTLAKISLDLPNEVREINRVIYTPGKPLKAEEVFSLTKTLMTHDAIRQALDADFVMRKIAQDYGYDDSRKCAQMPGILIPCNLGERGKRSFVIRPIWTEDFMAIIGMMPSHSTPSENSEEFFPEDMFFDMARQIPEKVSGISRVILDASDKPPASTEWE